MSPSSPSINDCSRNLSRGYRVTSPSSTVLDEARVTLGLSKGDLWFHYFELGGMSTARDLAAFLAGSREPSAHDHDLIAHALNEFFTELGQNHPVPYSPNADDEAAVITASGGAS